MGPYIAATPRRAAAQATTEAETGAEQRQQTSVLIIAIANAIVMMYDGKYDYNLVLDVIMMVTTVIL